MRSTAKKWAGTAGVALLIAFSTLPKRPATVAPGDHAYTKEYASWLIKSEMAKNH